MMKLTILILCYLVAVNAKAFKWHDTVTLTKDFHTPHNQFEVNQQAHLLGKSKEHIGQGDIMFRAGEEEAEFETDGKAKRDALRDPRAKWPGAVVPYTIVSMNAQGREALRQTVAEFKAKTCLKLVPRTNQGDYVKIIAAGGCYSYVGRIGGGQDLSIGRGCEYKSTVIHEFMHAMGFFHEQSRVDRDNFVNILTQNMVSGAASQFTKQRADVVQTFGHPYDYDSVMHYEKYAFSRSYGRLATITAKGNPDRTLGQPSNGGLSRIDALQLNAMYCGGSEPEPTDRPAPVTKKPTTGGLTKAQCLRRMGYCSRTIKKCQGVFANL